MESNGSIVSGCARAYKKQQLHRIFEENLLSSPYKDNSAVICNDSNISYNDLNKSANRIANLLIERIQTCKLQPNQDGDWIIAICMPPSNDFIVTLLAILKTGAAYLPMVSTFPQNRIDHILQEAKPVLVIYDGDTIQSNSFGSTVTLSFAECTGLSSNYDCANVDTNRTLRSPDVNNLALVLYTSGSTGIPKGVRLSHAAILNRLNLQWEQFPFSSTEQFCVFKTVVTFVDSVLEIWGTILARKTIVIVPKDVTKDPSQLVSLLQKYEIERIFLVPTLLKSILIYLSIKRDANLLRKLKLWICSGETLPMALANEFFDYFAENEYMLCNFYGCTETMGDVTYLVCGSKKQLHSYGISVPIGVPFFNTTIYVLDSERKPVEIGETGELYVSGPSIAQGYVNGRDKDRFIENILTKDANHSHLYRTGDYASVQNEGIIRYEGRTDSQVKIRGHRVDLSEIQKHLLEIDGVDKAIVLCYHAGQMDQTILAFVSVASPLNSKQKSLRTIQIEDDLRNKLVDYMVPQLTIVEEMPLLVNGKIDRQALLRMYEGMNNNDSSIVYDFNGVTQSERKKAGILFETITEVLGKSSAANMSLESNFYAIGGNSLNSIYTIAKLRERGYAIEITDFISATNLKEILARTKESDGNSGFNLISNSNNDNFTIEQLKMQHMDEAIPLYATSFFKKGDISIYLKDEYRYNDLIESLQRSWQTYLNESVSFIIKDKNDRMIGLCLNKRFHFDPTEDCSHPRPLSLTANVNAFAHYLYSQILYKLPADKPILENSFIATHECLSPEENIAAVMFMENESIRLSKKRNFYANITMNSNPLTQQLDQSVFGFEILIDFQSNQFVVDGRRPFAILPDSNHWMVQWKKN